jgi:SPX domain protein involved in polyphosphate accumulation
MAGSDKLQSQRFELKYHIHEQQAHSIRDFVLSYLEPDPFNSPKWDGAYPVNSLYLDSRTLRLCNDTLKGHKNRYKLRIRFYNEKPGSPTFFEIKQRRNDIIQKQRAMVYRESVLPLLSRHVPTRNDLMKSGDTKALGALQRFCALRDELRAEGAVYVSYLREAYVSHEGNGVRVTFDRNLVARAFEENEFKMPPLDEAVYPKVPTVVLELKFTDRFPNWMHDLVGMFNLRRESMPKYVECVSSLHNGRAIQVTESLREELL